MKSLVRIRGCLVEIMGMVMRIYFPSTPRNEKGILEESGGYIVSVLSNFEINRKKRICWSMNIPICFRRRVS